MKKQINAFDYAGHICEAMKKGILLTTKADGKLNTMTIGWGTIGIEWGRPVFVAYVRVGRHTRQMLDASGEFTVNIPYGDVDSKILGFCGTKSGRDTDKFNELGLEAVDSDVVSVPGIHQLPLTLEWLEGPHWSLQRHYRKSTELSLYILQANDTDFLSELFLQTQLPV